MSDTTNSYKQLAIDTLKSFNDKDRGTDYYRPDSLFEKLCDLLVADGEATKFPGTGHHYGGYVLKSHSFHAKCVKGCQADIQSLEAKRAARVEADKEDFEKLCALTQIVSSNVGEGAPK
jgi:hypothetical protein